MFHFQDITGRMNQANHILEKCMPFLTPTGVILGLLLGTHVSWMKPAVNWLFGFLTFTSALSITVHDIGTTLKKPKFIPVFFLSAIVALPLLAFASSSLLFPGEKDLISGFMLLMATPTAVVGSVWCSMFSGNMAVALTILLLDTLCAPFLTPFIVRLFTHASVAIDSIGMMQSLLFMVVIPSLLGILVNQLTKGKANDHVAPCLKPFGKIFLLMVIVINTSVSAPSLIASASWEYVPIALLCICLAVAGFPISYGFSRLFRLGREDSIAITFASSLRNISAALVLAIAYFAPEASLPVIFGIVFQQSVCAIMGARLFGNHDRIQSGKEHHK